MQHICAVALHDGQMYSIAGGSGGIVYIGPETMNRRVYNLYNIQW